MDFESERSPEAIKPEQFYRLQFFYNDEHLSSCRTNKVSRRLLDHLAGVSNCNGDRRVIEFPENGRMLTVFEFNTRTTELVAPDEFLVRTTACMFDWLEMISMEDAKLDRVELMTIVNGKQHGEREDQTIEMRAIEIALHEARHFDPNDLAL